MQLIAGAIENALSEKEITGPMPRITRGSFGAVAHEVGTMRMGKNVDESVVNENLQVHDPQNLFVGDLSVFPVSPSSNPTLTLAALSQRLGCYLEEQRQQQST
ncbi:hypothetical protein ANO14919_121640 [Xylariales sp. No.14919]|nr:hypothetical protein ANO14919_121640 [Xylariales sp. No.14919]